MGTANKNNRLMTLLSIWGIVLVVLGHSGFEETIIQDKLHFLHSWIYSFHMPLFFLISGFLYSLTNADFLKTPTLQFIKKKTIRLLVPYLVLGVILFAIKFAFSGLSHANRSFSVTAFFAMFVNTGYPSSTMGYLWYVFTLFVIFLLVSILALLRINLKDTRISLLLALGFWCLSYSCHVTGWANLSSVCRYIPYFLLGIAFEGKYEKIMQSISRGGGYIMLIITVLSSVILTVVKIPLPQYVLEPVRALIGVIMSVLLATSLLRSEWIDNNILPLGRYTYSIYLLSWFGQYAIKILVVNVLNLHWGLVVALMFVFGLLIPITICKIVEASQLLNKKWIRVIIGL